MISIEKKYHSGAKAITLALYSLVFLAGTATSVTADKERKCGEIDGVEIACEKDEDYRLDLIDDNPISGDLLNKITDKIGLEKKFSSELENQFGESPAEALMLIMNKYKSISDDISDYQEEFKQLKQIIELSDEVLKKGSTSSWEKTMPKPAITEITIEDAEDALNLVALRCSTPTDSDEVMTSLKLIAKKTGVSKTIKSLEKEYEDKKDKICDGVLMLYELKKKIEQLKDIRENGVSVAQKYRKKKNKFKGLTRTTTFSIDLRFYPDLQTLYEGENDWAPQLSIDNDKSYFKFSDNNKLYLASLLEVREDDTEDKCGRKEPLWIRLSAAIKIKFKPQNITEEKFDLRFCADFRYKGFSKSVSLAQKNIPAPFGYLGQVSDMKEEAKQKAMQKLQNELAQALGIDEKLKDISERFSKLP